MEKNRNQNSLPDMVLCCFYNILRCTILHSSNMVEVFFTLQTDIMYIGRVAIKNIFAHLAHFWHDLAKLPSHHIKQKQQPILKS